MQYMGKHCAHASCSSRFLLYYVFIQNRLPFLATPLIGFPPLLLDMHDVDVRLILIVHLIQNQLVKKKKKVTIHLEKKGLGN